MKFDVVIGNPPYQEKNKGENKQAQPIYHQFMQEAYKISDKVELITPARFLINPSRALATFSKTVLNSQNFKVSYFEQDSSKVFPNTDIKGGVAVSYYDVNASFEPIEVFVIHEELNTTMQKVKKYHSGNIGSLIYSSETWRFTDLLFEIYPDLISRTDKQHLKAMSASVFDRYPEVFYVEKPNDDFEYIKIFGKQNNVRLYKYVRKEFINSPDNLEKWKVFVPGANGTGAIGEVLSTPLIGAPLIGHTQTFISIGSFDTEFEANAVLKYIKSKFARAMLGVKKVTQNNQSKETWSEVPLQDFTPNSDIYWTKSIPEIDQQLYKKYGLNQEEINFIEEKVKAMD